MQSLLFLTCKHRAGAGCSEGLVSLQCSVLVALGRLLHLQALVYARGPTCSHDSPAPEDLKEAYHLLPRGSASRRCSKCEAGQSQTLTLWGDECGGPAALSFHDSVRLLGVWLCLFYPHPCSAYGQAVVCRD